MTRPKLRPFLLCLALLSSLPAIWAAAPSTQAAAAAMEQALPVPVVVLAGEPKDIGKAHGDALASRIKTLEKEYLDVLLGQGSQRTVALTAAALFETKIAADHRAEITAMGEAAGMDQRTALLAQCFLDLTGSIACSTVAFPSSASQDGVARMGRNLDFPSLNIADKMSVVLVYRPAGKHQFVAVGWPGMVGVLSGMNEHGLTLANMEVPRGFRFPSGMPYTLLYRTILEDCKTVDEAIQLLRDTPRQSANNLMLMDAAGNRAVVEIKPESIEVRRGVENAPLISTNHQRGQDLTTTGRCRRYDAIRRLSGESFGNINVATIESMLKTAQQGNFTIQSMVFEPATRTMYLATGAKAATQKYYRVDLNQHFKS